MSVKKREGIWQVTFRYKGQRVRRTVGKGATRQDAVELETQLRHEMRMSADDGAAMLGKHTIDEGMALWLINEVPGHKDPQRSISHARNARPYIEGVLLQDAERAAVHMVTDLTKQGRKAATINNRLWVIRRCLAACATQGWIGKGAKNDIKNMATYNERHVYLSYEQVAALAEHPQNPDCGRAIVLAAYTGLRRGELLRLRSDQVDDLGRISLGTDTKSGRPRVIPTPDFIHDQLLPLPLRVGDSQLRFQWQKARAREGLDHVHWHDLRHTYASWLIKSGVPLGAVRDLLGHRDFSTTSRYVSLETEYLDEQVKKLGHKSGHSGVGKKRKLLKKKKK